MIYSMKEQKRRKKFRIIVISLAAAIAVCIGGLVFGYLRLKENLTGDQQAEQAAYTVVSEFGIQTE